MNVFLYRTGDQIFSSFIKSFQADGLFKRKGLDELIIQTLLFLGDKSPEAGETVNGTTDEVEGKKCQQCHEPP